MTAPTNADLYYGDYIENKFDWYQNNNGPVPAGGKPWILLTSVEGWAGGGRNAASGGRWASLVIDFFIDNYGLNGLNVPFEFFICDGRHKLDASEADPYNQEHSYSTYWPDNVLDRVKCFRHLKSKIRRDPTRFPSLDPDKGGVWGWSSGGQAAALCALMPFPKTVGASFQRWDYSEDGPDFCVNWAGSTDLRPGAYQPWLQPNIQFFGVLLGDAVLESMGAKADWASAITHVRAGVPPMYNIYPNVGGTKPANFSHDRVFGEEMHAAYQSVGATSVFSLTSNGDQSFLANQDLQAIYDWMVGPTVLNI
jgi:hypothetical protein